MLPEAYPIAGLPGVAIPPGEILQDELAARGMTQAELALRCGRPQQAISEIINARKAITADTACDLERVLGIPASTWLSLERAYRETIARDSRRVALRADLPLLKDFPVAEMTKRGWITASDDRLRTMEALLGFLGIARLSQFQPIYQAAFRRPAGGTGKPGSIAVWLRYGERLAESRKLPALDKARLRASLPCVRKATCLNFPQACTEIRATLESCGVAWVLVEELPGTRVSGALHWTGPTPVVQQSYRYRREDFFWFTLFHEIGHLVLHGKTEEFVDFGIGSDGDDPKEREADDFAENTLIPPMEFNRLRALPRPLSEATVRRFADQISVAPGVVVGRLHHEKLLPNTHLHGLRREATEQQLRDCAVASCSTDDVAP